MDWVYRIEAKKTTQLSAVKKVKPKTRFFSSLFGSGESGTPPRTPSPPPPQLSGNEAEDLKTTRSTVVLTIFAADADVQLSPKLSAKIYRSTKKNPPPTLEYELIYVCHSPLSAAGDANTAFRRERMSTMQARKRMRVGPRQWVVFSRACAQTWMGEYVIGVHIQPLTFTQNRSCPCVHCQSCCECNEIIADSG